MTSEAGLGTWSIVADVLPSSTLLRLHEPITATLQTEWTRLSRAGDDILDSTQGVAERWQNRRRQQIRAARELMGAVMNPTRPDKAFEAWSRWLLGTVHRASEDVCDQIELGVKAAHSLSESQQAPPSPAADPHRPFVHASQNGDQAGARARNRKANEAEVNADES